MILKIKETVISLLQKYPHLRENDNKLIATVWRKEVGEFNMTSLSALGLLMYLAEGRLTSPENIRRARQKIQEKIPELRGLNYNNRQRKGAETKQIIKHL